MSIAKIRRGFVFSLIAAAGAIAIADLRSDDKPLAPVSYPAEDPRGRSLDANLYIQTSAEYRACCLQAYNLGLLRLHQCLSSGEKHEKPVAVVMDLDETVIDNSGFQAMIMRSGLGWDQRLWNQWQATGGDKLGSVPGAIKFINDARKAGVVTVFISNRDETYREQTKADLKRLEIPINDEKELKLATTTSDKTARREETRQCFDVLLYFGDNLRDFSDEFKCPDLGKKTPEELNAAIKLRKDQVDKMEELWGNRWIVFPNPAYGEWTKPLGQGSRDYDRLVPESK